jgi:Cof subfamily protein (haloacid dehalogenase superfamily)
MRYKAVYFDVDGTLVDDRRRFHVATVGAIHGLVRRGVRRGLATGRAYSSAGPYSRAIAADAPLVLYNGAQVVDPGSGEVLAARPLAREHALRALGLAKTHDLHVNLYLDRLYVERLGARARGSVAKDGIEAEPVGDLEAFLQGREEPTKMLLIGPSSACDRFKADLDGIYTDEPAPPTVVRSEPEYVEVLGPGVNKGQALGLACEAAGVDPEEVVAFGDSLNDLEMLALAGLGVAPENALPEVKRQAGMVIGDNEGPALGEALTQIFELEQP